MSFNESIKEAWPYLTAIATGGLVPLAIWIKGRLDRREELQVKLREAKAVQEAELVKKEAEQEDRRINALEAIVPAIAAQGKEITVAIAAQSKEVGDKIERMHSEILAAIRSEDIQEIKSLLNPNADRDSGIKQTPPQGTPAIRQIK